VAAADEGGRVQRMARALAVGLSALLDPVLRLIEWVVAALAVAMVGVVFVQVVLRYGFNSSFFGSEELARFIFVWFIFLSATLSLERGMHFAVDLVVDRFPLAFRQAVAVLVQLVVLAVLMVLLVKGIELAHRNMRQLSSAMQIRLTWPYTAIPVAAFLMALVTLRRLLHVFARERVA
jgi:TRAP-type C4-dicarboxylate transport system permease small subunit